MIAYKFLHAARIDILSGGMIRFTQPPALNDPFESFPLDDDFKDSLIERSVNRENIHIKKLSP